MEVDIDKLTIEAIYSNTIFKAIVKGDNIYEVIFLL